MFVSRENIPEPDEQNPAIEAGQTAFAPTPETFAGLPVARLEFVLRAEERAELPNFLGSTLRGAFGYALKRAVCVMERRDCETCPVVDRCLYPYLFETPPPPDLPQLRSQQQMPHPFIFEPPHTLPDRHRQAIKRGEELGFGLILIGKAIEAAPYVIYAIDEMAYGGLGAGRGRFTLTEIHWFTAQDATLPAYSAADHRLVAPPNGTMDLNDYLQKRLTGFHSIPRLRLRFLTPTRIRIQGDVQTAMSFDLLLGNLWRRLLLLQTLHGAQPIEPARLDKLWWRFETGVQCARNELRFWDWERHSNRQQRKVKLGGFIGEVEYEGEKLAEYLPLILAGELLHVGGGTGFGLGRYQIIN